MQYLHISQTNCGKKVKTTNEKHKHVFVIHDKIIIHSQRKVEKSTERFESNLAIGIIENYLIFVMRIYF